MNDYECALAGCGFRAVVVMFGFTLCELCTEMAYEIMPQDISSMTPGAFLAALEAFQSDIEDSEMNAFLDELAGAD